MSGAEPIQPVSTAAEPGLRVADFDFELPPEPVSYTHLFPGLRRCFLFRPGQGKRGASHYQRRQLWPLRERRCPKAGQGSVSYTHLDVYKRQRQLLLHRCRMVRMRTRIKNQLDGMAKNEGLSLIHI